MHAVILNKQQESKWDAFSYTHPYSSIHQTSKWAHFQSNVPSRDKFWIIALFADAKSTKSKILAGTVLIKHLLPKNYCWLYAPRGPLLNYEKPKLAKEQMTLLLEKIKEIAKEEKAIFFRADPLIEIQNPSLESSKPANSKSPNSKSKRSSKSLRFPSFHFSHLGYQPEDTLIINLAKPEEEILKQMKEKGRYNIRLADKKGVKIIEVDPFSAKANSKTQIEDYFKILQETLKRDKFYGHGIGFYKNMIEKLAPDPAHTATSAKSPGKGAPAFAQMFLAEYNGITIAGIIDTFYKDTAIYYYGASSNEYRNVMAPYLLQWHAMKKAKSLGCTKYDLLGIAPPITAQGKNRDELGPKSHPWRGVTEFKRKFGGAHIKYLPPQEYAFRPFLYFLYAFFKKLRKIFR